MAEDTPVATLTFVNERSGKRVEDALSICPTQEIILGCKHVQQHVDDFDPTISRRHIILRCVQFDEDATKWQVAPMVYVEDASMNGTILARDCPADDGSTTRLDHKLTKSMGPVLLQHGDCLYFSKSTFVEYREISPDSEDNMSLTMSCEVQRLAKFIVFPRLIGAGGQGQVFIAWDEEAGQQVACKAVSLDGVVLDCHDGNAPQVNLDKTRDTPSVRRKVSSTKVLRRIHRLEAEYDILKDLSHPNIIDMRKVFICTHHIYILQELMASGDLFSFIFSKGGSFTESLSAVITLQMLKAVKYLHDNGIVHRDIKPENILINSWKDVTRIVLTDFGMAKRIGRCNSSASRHGTRFRMFSFCGTYGFTAPEVQKLNPTVAENGGYSSAIDMWSVGTVTAVMLTGNLAFDQKVDDECVGKINSRSYSAYDLSAIDQAKHGWDNVSKRARDFVRSLLVLQEDKRLTAKKALQHHWFTNQTCAASFEAVYQQSISDWKPRTTPKEDIVVEIDTSDIAIPTPSASQNARRRSDSEIIKSQFFQDEASDEPQDQANATSDDHGTAHNDEGTTTSLAASPPSQTSGPKDTRHPSYEFSWPSPATHRKKLYSNPAPLKHPNTSAIPPSNSNIQLNNTHFQSRSSAPARVPQSSDSEHDLDTLKPSHSLAALQPSMEFTWPSSPPNNRKRRAPSFEFSWPSPPRRLR